MEACSFQLPVCVDNVVIFCYEMLKVFLVLPMFIFQLSHFYFFLLPALLLFDESLEDLQSSGDPQCLTVDYVNLS